MKTSFIELLSDNSVVIPIIQRDYAQGRTDTKTTRIRKDFLDAIFHLLHDKIDNGETKSLHLDFIYGFSTGNNGSTTFAPIDGQQRLTTLWLLLLYVSMKEGFSEEQRGFLRNFKYETRHSTYVFCDELLRFVPAFDGQPIDKEIKNQSWYIEAWDYDPSIKAMLVMLHDISVRYSQLNSNKVWEIINHTENPFFFHKLDMESVGLPDDLYIKMNSRGKPLTEFEYFKAGFSDIIRNGALKKRFEFSVDQEWAECIWKIVFEKFGTRQDIDIALLVDDCFIRLVNYVTGIIAYKQGLEFVEINHSLEDTKRIYQLEDNLVYLFDVLDCIVRLQSLGGAFWSSLYYISKQDFIPRKSRLFFQNSQINLLEKCLFNYDKKGKGFSYGEQLMLFACITHLLTGSQQFERVSRIIRNLVANSENELREAIIGQSFKEVETFVTSLDFTDLVHFKTDQISEEEEKNNYIKLHPSADEHIYQLEDSEVFRGCISIFDFDDRFMDRKRVFLTLFDEDVIQTDFVNRSNVLLSFGDYSQDDGMYTNLLAKGKGSWRDFFTTPAYNKAQLIAKSKVTLMQCLDYFHANPSVTLQDKISTTLHGYANAPKDWIFYFLKYPGFRVAVNRGYYYWNDTNPYPLFKMKEKQFNGYHWDPFLAEIKRAVTSDSLKLDNGGEMQITLSNELFIMKSVPDGFAFERRSDSDELARIFDGLVSKNIIDAHGILRVIQDANDLDMEDRIEKGIDSIQTLFSLDN